MSNFLSFLDPPDHTRLRLLVSKALVTFAVEELRPEINRIADDLLENISQSADLVSQFARPLSCQVMASALGLPKEDHGQFTLWVDTLLSFMGSSHRSFEIAATAQRSALELKQYLEATAAEQRTEPGLSLVTQLLVAGFETSMSLISSGILLLIQHPGQLHRLQQNSAAVASAVEEILRYHSPLQFVMREGREPLRLGNRQIQTGQLLFLMLGAANRDPTAFPIPDRFNIGREPNHHLTFGHGIHFCVGAQLARLQGQIAISKITERFPGIQLELPAIHWRKSTTHRHLTSLQVRLRS